MANSLLVGADSSGSDSSTTKAAVSAGTITVRDTANQQQDVAELSRDAEHANQTLSPIFDKEKEQQRLKEAQLIGEIGSQAADIARTQGQIIATKAANENMKDVTPEQLQAAKEAWTKANPGKEAKTKDITDQAYQDFYNQAFTDSGFGTGGKVQQALQAATAAVQGLAGGDIAKAIAGGSAPYLATVIHNMTTDPVTGEVNKTANLMAHAAVNAALAVMQGNNALSGAAGAVTAETVGMIALEVYGKKAGELSESEKQTVSALATLAAGLAGGLVGNSTADVVAGAQAGKTTVENNALGGKPGHDADELKLEHGDRPLKILDINPMIPKVLGDDGEPAKTGGIAGKSKDTKIWTETKKDKSVPNAYGHWEKHKGEFPEYQNAKQYVDATHSFVTTPPQGTLTKTRTNGDTLYYNPATNTFASQDVNGVPRTMFKPEKVSNIGTNNEE